MQILIEKNRILKPHTPLYLAQQLSIHGQFCFINTITYSSSYQLDYFVVNPRYHIIKHFGMYF